MMLQAERFWPIFAATVGRPDILERYPSAEARRDQAAAIRDELVALFATRSRAEWEERLRASECIWGPFQTPLDLPGDPQVQANGYLLSSPTADGPVQVCANPVQFSGEAPEVRSPAQDAGAQTEEVLLELDCSWDDIGRWKDAGVIS
jgi:crotonobetainyl-CoA:carnitine CoA-transferase CaiB-like acyl-CoA transferase